MLRGALLIPLMIFGATACSSTPSDIRDSGVPPDDSGSPYLTALRVSSPSDESPVELFPSFAPDVHDYYVRCHAGHNELVVTMTASAGATSSTIRPTASQSAPEQRLVLQVDEGAAIVAAASSHETVEYWVRCLPHDFPTLVWTEHPEAGRRPPGYYLLGTAAPPSTRASYAFILDGHGVPVWYDRPTAPVGAGGLIDVDHVVPGAISYYKREQGSPPRFDIRDIATGVTTYAGAGKTTDEHELRRLPNGHFITLSLPVESGVDLTGLRIPLVDGGAETLSGRQNVVGCDIQEFTPDGTIVWRWSAADHFAPVRDSTWVWVFPVGVVFYDVYHCNSVDVDPKSGNLLVSARDMDSIFYVERSTGAVLWKMGGKPYTKDGAAYVAVSSPFYRQHDARLLPGWSETCSGARGQVSLFDDHTDAPGKARGVVYDVVVRSVDGGPSDCGAPAADAATSRATVAWEYEGRDRSDETGSFRISPDGSRVIGWGANGEGRVFTEVNEAKAALADLRFSDNDSSYRAIKVPLSAFDLGVLRRTSGRP